MLEAPYQPLERGLFFDPWRAALDDGVCVDEELAGAGDEGVVVSLSAGFQACV